MPHLLVLANQEVECYLHLWEVVILAQRQHKHLEDTINKKKLNQAQVDFQHSKEEEQNWEVIYLHLHQLFLVVYQVYLQLVQKQRKKNDKKG